MALERNKLNKFSSFNCIWFLDIATPAEQISGAYREKRGRIIRSSGIADTAGAELQTLDERNIGIKGEYFIDNIIIDAAVAPNPYSGLAFASHIEFEVTEPYSIGLFLETMQLAAEQAGFKNYIDASFVLGVEFVGYDSNKILSTIEKKVLLIKLTNIEFSVSAAGSVYKVEAIPWNHQALIDEVTKIPVNISIKGDTVEEILTSLDQEGITETVTNTRPDGLGADVVEISGTRSLIKALNDHESYEIDKKAGSANVTSTEYEILFPIDPSQLGTRNDFSSQKISENVIEISDQDLGLHGEFYDELNSFYSRTNLQLSENGRVYQFKKGTKIEKIIEEVILTSEWVKDIVNLKPDEDGYIEWFKILTFVQTIGDSSSRDRFGSQPKKYTYIVHPYKFHASSLATTSDTINYNSLIKNADRGYSYTYTGENTDIIDFNIQLDIAWMQAIQNLADTDKAARDQGAALFLQERVPALINQGKSIDTALSIANSEIAANKGGITDTFSNYGGIDYSDSQIRAAKAFNDAIMNSNSDLISINMTIWGDPYFLSDNDFGGFLASANAIGSMDHIRKEVDVLLNFSSAVDYRNSLLQPNTNRQFVGVYKLYKVVSTFSSNLFKQELELIRRRNHDDASKDNTINAIEARDKNLEPFLKPASRGVSANDINLFLRQAEETELMFNIFGQLKLQDLTAALNITPFGLISQLNGFSQLFDQARQIRSAIGNLGSLASNINLTNLNSQVLSQLSRELTEAQDYFDQAFAQIDVSSITQTLNQDLSNIAGQFRGSIAQVAGQIQGTVGEFQGAVRTLSNLPNQIQRLPSQTQQEFDRLFTQSGRGNLPIPQSVSPQPQGLQSALRPPPRPQNLNPTGTRLIETPDGPRRVVVGSGGRDQVLGSSALIDRRSGGAAATGGTFV